MKKILVTGGSGFIGRNIKESYLNEKYELLTPSHQELDLMNFESTTGYMLKHWPDIIVHTATVHNEPEAVYKNTMMWQNIMRFSSECDKIINLSSGAVYDRNRMLTNVKENELGLHMPTDWYGFSKYLNASYSANYCNVVELFLFGIFGKYELSTRFITNTIHRVLDGRAPYIYKNRFMSYIDIDDFIKVLDRFIQQEDITVWQRYNITTGQLYDLYYIAELIMKIAGKPFEIELETVVHAPDYTGSNERLVQLFPDLQFTPIEVAIEKLYNHLRGEHDQYR